ncbi:MAG TPA: trypsin-like peptidase domain-containing protein [Candidatus Acidoferrum sp.]|nr:trypsin-like peptidase domain-containing protein [Candidatus Acidoferrum sp.]
MPNAEVYDLAAKLRLVTLAVLVSLSMPLVLQAQEGPRFKKLRSVSGASGHEENGRYVMDDARSTFIAGKDTKVIVYFEWEGPLGPHHFEGLWKDPEGKIAVISDFSYEAKGPQFSGYWTMLLSPATPSGEWTIEARIDGEAAGSHSFVITGSAPPPTFAPAVPQPLTGAELYKTAMDATAVLEKVGPDGIVIGKYSAFWIANGQALTTFGAIDGATAIRLQSRDGTQETTDQVLAWNRWQDWALLKVPGQAPSQLKRGPKKAVNVGDNCVFLEWGPAGAKITDGSITGKNTFPRAGARLLVASAATMQSFGGALLDPYGEYVGLIGGAIAPGGEPMKILGLMNQTGNQTGYGEIESSALAVPLSLLPMPMSNEPTSLGDLARRGEFLPVVVKSHDIGLATLTSYIEKRAGQPPFVTDYRQVFSHRDANASVFVNWTPSEKVKTICVLRLYNLENVLLTESKPQKLSLSPGRYMSTTWNLPLIGLSPGIYRVDLLLGDQIVWRDFLRVTE